MKKSHWLGAVIVLLVGYALGIFFPGPGQAVKGKIAGARGA
jgi:hypothetical protein